MKQTRAINPVGMSSSADNQAIVFKCAPEYYKLRIDHAGATTVICRQYFQDNFCYRKCNVMSHYTGIVIIFLQQEGITNMEQPAKSSTRNPINYMGDS